MYSKDEVMLIGMVGLILGVVFIEYVVWIVVGYALIWGGILFAIAFVYFIFYPSFKFAEKYERDRSLTTLFVFLINALLIWYPASLYLDYKEKEYCEENSEYTYKIMFYDRGGNTTSLIYIDGLCEAQDALPNLKNDGDRYQTSIPLKESFHVKRELIQKNKFYMYEDHPTLNVKYWRLEQ